MNHASRWGFIPVNTGPTWAGFLSDVEYITERRVPKADEPMWREHFSRGQKASEAIAERHAAGLPY